MELWQQRPRPVVSAVIINKDKKILLTLRSNNVSWPGQWCLPGGHLKGGQDWSTACREEVQEETGLEVVKAELVGIYSDPKFNQLWEVKEEKTISFVAASFLIREFRGETKITDEVAALDWFSWEALPEPLIAIERIKIGDALAFQGQVFVR